MAASGLRGQRIAPRTFAIVVALGCLVGVTPSVFAAPAFSAPGLVSVSASAGSVAVGVTARTLVPSSIEAGASGTLTLYGSGLSAPLGGQFSGQDVQVLSFQVLSPNVAQLRVTVAVGAAAGPRSFSLVRSGRVIGRSSASLAVTARPASQPSGTPVVPPSAGVPPPFPSPPPAIRFGASEIGASALELSSRRTIERGQLLVVWTDRNEAMRGFELLSRDYGAALRRRSDLKRFGWVFVELQFASNADAARVRALLRRQHPTWLVDFNARYRVAGARREYAFRLLGQRAAKAVVPIRNPVRVGLIDTPVAAIPALRYAGIVRADFLFPGDKPAHATHATAIAALIAADGDRFTGLARGARLFAANVMRIRDGEPDTNAEMLLHALDWLLSMHVRVINMSLGGPPNRVLEAAVSTLRARGVVLVAAAGNSGPDAPPVYPAAYPGVIAVTACDAAKRIYAYANRGRYIALTAPGVDVWVPDAHAGHYVTGTSFAAPFVTAAVARELARDPHLGADGVAKRLCATAEDLGRPGRDPVFGCGLVQLHPRHASR